MPARSGAAAAFFVMQSDAACVDVDISRQCSKELSWTLPSEIQAQFQRFSLLHLFYCIYTFEKGS